MASLHQNGSRNPRRVQFSESTKFSSSNTSLDAPQHNRVPERFLYSQPLNSPNLGSEASVLSFESQDPGDWTAEMEAQKSKLKADAAPFTPRGTHSMLHDANNRPTMGLMAPPPMRDQNGPFTTTPRQQTTSYPQTFQQERVQPVYSNLRPRGGINHQSMMASHAFPQSMQQPIYVRQPPGRNFGHQHTMASPAVHSSTHMVHNPYTQLPITNYGPAAQQPQIGWPNSFSPGNANYPPPQMHGAFGSGNMQQNHWTTQAPQRPPRPAQGLGFMIPQTQMPKTHGGGPFNERFNSIRHRGPPGELNLDYRFPNPTAGDSSNLIPRNGENQPAANGNTNLSSTHAQSATHLVAADINVPARQGHMREQTAIRIPEQANPAGNAAMASPSTPVRETHSTNQGLVTPETPTRFIDGVPFGPTPPRAFGREHSLTVSRYPMSEDETPRAPRHQSADLSTSGLQFDLNSLRETSSESAVVPAYTAIVHAQTQGDASSVSVAAPVLVPVGSLDDKSGTLKKFVSTFNKDGNPTFERALEYLPLDPPAERSYSSPKYGVLRLRNIPFSVGRSEILAFFGKGSRLVIESEGEPVHIILDLLTGKTMDAFVEFQSESDAMKALDRYNSNKRTGKAGRLGDRHIEVDLVDPKVLMENLFPKTKHVIWEGYEPIITDANPNDPFDTPFQEFITTEELDTMFRLVEAPNRSTFTSSAPQRPYECLISTMHKYPWHLVKYILVRDRNHLYNVVLESVAILKEVLAFDTGRVNTCLNRQLLVRMCHAVRLCRGFTLAQKAEIHHVAQIKAYWNAPHAEDWIWVALTPKKTVVDETDVIEYYIKLINKLSAQQHAGNQRQPLPGEVCNNSVWGLIRPEYPYNWGDLTLEEVGIIEHQAIQRCLELLPSESPTPHLPSIEVSAYN